MPAQQLNTINRNFWKSKKLKRQKLQKSQGLTKRYIHETTTSEIISLSLSYSKKITPPS